MIALHLRLPSLKRISGKVTEKPDKTGRVWEFGERAPFAQALGIPRLKGGF
jgi:hypothetical protein